MRQAEKEADMMQAAMAVGALSRTAGNVPRGEADVKPSLNVSVEQILEVLDHLDSEVAHIERAVGRLSTEPREIPKHETSIRGSPPTPVEPTLAVRLGSLRTRAIGILQVAANVRQQLDRLI
jgi:hypothetical protein